MWQILTITTHTVFMLYIFLLMTYNKFLTCLTVSGIPNVFFLIYNVNLHICINDFLCVIDLLGIFIGSIYISSQLLIKCCGPFYNYSLNFKKKKNYDFLKNKILKEVPDSSIVTTELLLTYYSFNLIFLVSLGPHTYDLFIYISYYKVN